MENIEEKIKKLADKKYKEFHSKLCPDTDNILGVRVPVVKDYAKKLFKENPNINVNEIGDKYYEQIMLQGLIIGLKKLEFNELKKEIEVFVSKIYNWAICDTFCASLKMTKKYKEQMKEVIYKYLKSDKEFELRFSLVMLLDYYIDEENIDEVLEIYNSINSDYYYVKMAVAWGLSFCLIKFWDKTIESLKNSKIDDFTYNKAIQKGIESYRISEENKKIL